MFCQSFNATVPYPKTNEENQYYRDAFDSMNISTSVAIQSRHGIVEMKRNGDWSPFPATRLMNGACEKTLVAKLARFKRQTNSGKTRNSCTR